MNALLRPAQPTDAGGTGAILEGFMEETRWMPKLYSGAEVIGFCGQMIDRGWVTVAVRNRRVLGFVARDGDEIKSFFVAAGARGQGIGQQMMQDAMARRDTLRLTVFAANHGAVRFYRRAGFAEVGKGDGSGNEEGLPDIRLVWKREQSA